MADNFNDMITGLNIFKQGVKDLQMTRTINSANDAVQQIRSSEMKDEDKTNALRGLAEQLTYSLAAQGTPATTIEGLTKYIPEQKIPGSAEQAFLYGSPTSQAGAQSYLDLEQKNKLEQIRALNEGKLDVAGVKSAQQGSNGDSKEFQTASKFIQPDQSVRNAFGAAQIVKQNAERLKALIGNDMSDAALNKVPPQFISEAAQGLARMVKGGSASEGEVREFLPKDVGMDASSMANYFANKPGGAGQAGFLRLYMKAADREHALASQQVEDSVLQRAQGQVKTLIKDPEATKNYLSSLIPGAKPEDIVVDPATKTITTVQRLQQSQKLDSYIPRVRQLISQSKSPNPSDRNEALRQLNLLNIDPSRPMKEIQNDIFTKIKSGEW